MRWKLVWLFATLSVTTGTSIVSISSDQISVSIDGPKTVPKISQTKQDYLVPAQNRAKVTKNTAVNDASISSDQYKKIDENDHSEKEIRKRMSILTNKGGGSDESVETDEIAVETSYGPVQGISQGDEEIIKFFDIPYGKFKLFEAPTEPDKWSEIRKVETHQSKCPQIEEDVLVGSTDCLTLSVFVPKDVTNAGVLFYLHESNFKTGSGDPSIYGPEYLVKKGIVLVLPNFRLGPLGFLCLQNSTAPGNAALKDLTLALQWTTNNIKEFGGNPSNIVVSGDGSSSALAGYLALSSASTDYISKVILDSGSVISHGAIDRHPEDTAIKLADTIRQMNPEEKFEDCLFIDIDIETLIKAAKYTQFKPCVEKITNIDFISETPWSILTNKTVTKSFIIGSASHAGLQEALEYEGKALLQLNNDFSSVLPNDLVFKNENIKREWVNKIKQQYFGEGDITSSDLYKLSIYKSDVSYAGPDIRSARALVDAGATVYLYEFSFMGQLNKELQNVNKDYQFGAMRGDLKGYLFTQGGIELAEGFTEEKKIIEIMTNLWASFIDTGKPTSDEISWNHLNETSDGKEHWLSINRTVSPVAGFHPERLDLWTELYRDHFVDGNVAANMKSRDLVLYFSVFCLIALKDGFILKDV